MNELLHPIDALPPMWTRLRCGADFAPPQGMGSVHQVMALEFFSAGRNQVIDLRPSHVEQLIARVFEVFDVACDLHEVEAAQDILQSARMIMARNGLPADAERDRSAQLLVDAHFRLWELRYLVR